MKHTLLALAFICQPVFAFSSADAFFLIFRGIEFIHTNSVPKEIVITETGIGSTQTEAVENALQLAISKGIGVLIVTDQTVEGDRVVRNLAAAYSSGVVNSYEIRSCKKNTSVVCEVTAKVSPWNFMRKLEGDSQTMQVNGDDLLMKHRTAQATMQQRRKITEYYFSQIRQSGLDAKIRSVQVLPNDGDDVAIRIRYAIKWDETFKEDMIRFLKLLQKDTGGSFQKNDIVIQWAAYNTNSNRAFINTHDSRLRHIIENKMYEPVYINIRELNICDKIDLEGSIFTFETIQEKTYYINSNYLKHNRIRQLSISTHCNS
jgi:hypothetical protein